MSHSLLLILIQISLFLLTLSSSFSYKEQKAHACSILSRDRLSKDYDYFNYVSSFVDPNAEENERTQSLLSVLLLSCFKNINKEQVKTVIKDGNENNVKSLSEEYKKVLGLEEWESVFSENDQKKIENQMMMYKNEILELRSLQKEESTSANGKGKQTKKEKKNENEERGGNDEVNNRVDDRNDYDITNSKKEFTILGYDISKISYKNKMLIGLSLLIFIFVAFAIFAKRAIDELPENKKKNKKKKNKNEKEE